MYNLKWYNIFSLVKIRRTQLEDEEKIDKMITNIKNTCPDLVIEYLLKYRELNRVLSDKLYHSDFYAYPDIFTSGVNIVNEEYSKVLMITDNNLITNREKCNCFKKFISSMDKSIEKNKSK